MATKYSYRLHRLAGATSLVILTERVSALWTLVKHRLPLIRAPQLHRVKVQPLVPALRTPLVHRRPFSRHLLRRAHLASVRVSRLHAVVKLELRRAARELSLVLAERGSLLAS